MNHAISLDDLRMAVMSNREVLVRAFPELARTIRIPSSKDLEALTAEIDSHAEGSRP